MIQIRYLKPGDSNPNQENKTVSLNEMNLAELRKLAKDLNVDSNGLNEEQLRNLIWKL